MPSDSKICEELDQRSQSGLKSSSESFFFQWQSTFAHHISNSADHKDNFVHFVTVNKWNNDNTSMSRCWNNSAMQENNAECVPSPSTMHFSL